MQLQWKVLYRWGIVFLIGAVLASACSAAATTQPAQPTVVQQPPATNQPTATGEQSTSVPPAASEAPLSTEKGNLVVLEWSGYELPEFWEPFAQQYPNVKVDFSFFAEDAEALAKVQSGFEADVIHPCSSWVKQYAENGLIQPIDPSRLKNWSGITPQLADQGKVDGVQYLVPWDWGYETVLVRTDKVKTTPTSWNDLWNSEYAGHVSLYDSGESAWLDASLALGLDPYNTTLEQNQAIKQKLLDLKPNLLNYWSDFTEITQLVASGDVWVAGNVWPDAYLNLLKEGVPVVYTEPKEGRLGYVCGYVISSKTQNLDLAYAYIDAAIAPQSMANLSNEYGYGAANKNALPLTDPQTVKELQLDQPDIMSRTFFYQPLNDQQRQLFTSTWSEVKAAP
jgi:spermidine/putrescine transport system substrate-binding protein